MKSFKSAVLRREMRASRAVASIVVAVLVGLLSIFGILEAFLRATGQPEWVMDPFNTAQKLAALPAGVSNSLLLSIACVVVVLGLILLVLAVVPGRRARHTMATDMASDEVAIVVDDEVIASALARCARLAAGVTREQVMVVLSATTARVNIRPTSGTRIDVSAIQAGVEAELKEMRLDDTPRVTVAVAATGVVGV